METSNMLFLYEPMVVTNGFSIFVMRTYGDLLTRWQQIALRFKGWICDVGLNKLRKFSFAGGDDVQQLCDAGEEEFLEIMALVGMASKPLHVRRLQKALQEWVSNPGKSASTPSDLNLFQKGWRYWNHKLNSWAETPRPEVL